MFKVNRKALETELALLQSVAEKKGTMPILSILSTVLFSFDGETLTLTGSDIDTTLVTQIPASGEKWAGCIPSRQLYDLSRLLYGDEITFAPEDGRVVIKLGKSKHKLPTYEADQFPVIEHPQVETVGMDGAAFSMAIQRALRCVTADATEFWMRGVSLRSIDGKMFIAGTNGRHFSVTEVGTPLIVDVVLPLKAASSLTKLINSEVQVGVSESQIVFRQGEKTFTARLLDARFPDWRPLVPSSFKHNLDLNTESARQAFRLAAVTAYETAMIPIPIRLTLTQSEMMIETNESERGHSSETVAISCATLNGHELSRGVNGQHFIGFFEEDMKTIMSFDDDMRIIQLTYESEPGYRYITMALKA